MADRLATHQNPGPEATPEAFAHLGYSWFRDAVPSDDLARMDRLIGPGNRPGHRLPPATLPPVFQSGGAVAQLVSQVCPGAFPVRVVAFNKDAAQNWAVPWHQDRVIAVEARAEVPGFTNWSCKDGTWHCEPPPSLWQRMVFLRVHLDPCGANDGGMEIAQGSHRAGLVPADRVGVVAAQHPTVPCVAGRGDIQMLDMAILHRSRRAMRPVARRVLRIDYANTDLPAPLRWAP